MFAYHKCSILRTFKQGPRAQALGVAVAAQFIPEAEKLLGWVLVAALYQSGTRHTAAKREGTKWPNIPGQHAPHPATYQVEPGAAVSRVLLLRFTAFRA